jgi:glycosyltransferase involved in cell wall biosynthesis
MTIGVSALGAGRDTPAGTGNACTEILLRMCRLYPDHNFILFFDRPVPPQLALPSNARPLVVPAKGARAWQRRWWWRWRLPRALSRQRPDVFLGMDGLLPLSSSIPAVLFIKDLSFLHSVAGGPQRWQRFLKKNTLQFIARSQQVVALSGYLQQQLLEYAPGVADKLHVVPAGVHESYRPLSWEEREAVKQQYTGSAEFFIAVGSLHPRNNIIPLLKAFSALKRRLRSNMKLVLAGPQAQGGEEIADSLRSYKFRQDVVWLQNPGQAELAQLTGAAYALVYTPRFEGAALPIYAALQCQVPVIAIDSAPAREAGGEAALYTNPDNLGDLADKMCLLYKDEQLRARLLAGIPAAPQCNWNECAEGIIRLLKH